ncbi:MAG: DNA-binding transcriptional regulator OxyR [Gammaproteobacteria bacterium]
MNLRDLKYLVAVAEYEHFGKAADACFVSQPTLSMQIKKLEETLGVILIERTNKSVLFTEIGRAIVAQAQEVLHQAQSLKELARQATNPFSGSLHLGIIPTLAPYLCPRMVPALSARFPDLTLCLVEEKTENLMKKLSQGKLDAAILALPLKEDSFITEILFEEKFLLATPMNHPLAKRKKIALSDLENETLLLLDDGHCFRDQALAVCQRVHATESKQFQATSLETLRYMVASHAGITLMPALSCRDNDGVCYREFHGTQPSRTLGMVWRQASAKKKLLQELVGEIKNFRPQLT